MRAIIQCVSEASVTIANDVVGAIGPGFLIFLGVGHNDTEAEARKLWSKIERLRIFDDEQGKTNLNLAAVGGDALIVSQFTLYANCKKGNRPSFTDAAEPAKAEQLYEYFVSLARMSVPKVETGRFGAMMEVSLVNHGPFTICLDTDNL